MEILNHGYLNLVESWGSDERIIEAARMSTGKGFLGWGSIDVPGDEKLLRYLWEHKHATPFEMGGATFEIQAPIFVFREWHRHRTQSYNEMSGRYTVLPDLFYIPSDDRVRSGRKGAANRQGSAEESLSREQIRAIQAEIGTANELARNAYMRLLDLGVARELARTVIPVGQYSRMRASANLRNWLAFLSLRMDNAAQWEIRQYANALHDELAVLFPRTISLFDERR